MKKDLQEFISYAQCFPTAIAEVIGNTWKPEDVIQVLEEIRILMKSPPTLHHIK